MIAANKRRTKAKRHGKKNPIARAGTKAGARKAARTRAAKKAKRSRAAKKGHRARKARPSKARKSGKRKASRVGKSSKRSRAAKKAARTRKANAEMRSARAKKAARSRKRKGGKRKSSSKRRSPKRSSSKRRSPKKSKARRSGKRSTASYRKAARKAARTRAAKRSRKEATKYDSGYSGGEYGERRRAKRRGKGRRRGKRNPLGGIRNPIPLEGGLDFFSGLFAVTLGYLFASGADRMGSTHALTASSSQGGYTDAPAAGQIYNSEATSLPIWSSGMRIAFNALAIAVPLGLSAFIKARGPKSFFQLMSFAAIARTVGKAADDGLSMALASTSFGLRVYAPELAAGSKMTQATAAALPAAAPGTFAGIPRAAALSAGPTGDAPQSNEHQAVASVPQTAFKVAQPSVQPPIANDQPYFSGPQFNPWAVNE